MSKASALQQRAVLLCIASICFLCQVAHAVRPSVSAGDFHSAALNADGTIRTWGGNSYGELGDARKLFVPSPVVVPGITGIVSISNTSSLHTLALRNDGRVFAWGSNFFGELGDGTTDYRAAPVPVTGLAGVVAIAAGVYQSVALKSDGTVWRWGYNFFGFSSVVPVRIGNLAQITAIAPCLI